MVWRLATRNTGTTAGCVTLNFGAFLHLGMPIFYGKYILINEENLSCQKY